MPPKTRFRKEEIVDAAFAIAREKGFEEISARNVAKRLGSSVAPIYVNFANIEELTKAVVQKVLMISSEILARQKGSDIFTNIGRASLEFAREYPVLLRELTLKPNPYVQSYESMEKGMIEAMGNSEEMKNWNLEERKELFFKMRAFQTGMVAMVANGQIPSWMDEKKLEDILMEVGEDLQRIQQKKREEQEG